MILLAIPNIGDLEGRYLQECVTTNFVSSVGPFVDRFELEVGKWHGGERGVAMSSGTSALHVGLVALGVEPGDLVICPSFTFIATANAISHQHAVPWLIDIDPDSWTLDPVQLRRELEVNTEQRDGKLVHRESGRRVAAIVPVYTLGTPAEMDEINLVASEYGLPVLADAAAAIGVTYKDKPLNGLADLTSFSFNGNKTMTTGGGGMLIGHNTEALARAKHLSTTARISPDYDYDMVGFNYRMTNIQAAVGCAQLQRLDGFLDRKRAIRKRYNTELANVDRLTPFPLPAGIESACWFSGTVLDRDHPKTVAEICALLREHGIEGRPFWKPVHLQAPYNDVDKADLSVTNDLWNRVLTLPCGTGLTDEDQEKVISTLKTIIT